MNLVSEVIRFSEAPWQRFGQLDDRN